MKYALNDRGNIGPSFSGKKIIGQCWKYGVTAFDREAC